MALTKNNAKRAMVAATKLAMIVCPSEKEQKGFSMMLEAMKAHQVPLESQVQQIVDAINDGLGYRKWPN